jgi:hypothetical protein
VGEGRKGGGEKLSTTSHGSAWIGPMNGENRIFSHFMKCSIFMAHSKMDESDERRSRGAIEIRGSYENKQNQHNLRLGA